MFFFSISIKSSSVNFMGKRTASQNILASYPEPSDTQTIAKVVEIRGGGLYDVRLPGDIVQQLMLVNLPKRFKNVVFVKKGN